MIHPRSIPPSTQRPAQEETGGEKRCGCSHASDYMLLGLTLIPIAAMWAIAVVLVLR